MSLFYSENLGESMNFLRRFTSPLAGVSIILVLFQLNQLPVLSHNESVELVSHFAFKKFPLPEAPTYLHKSQRAVNPSLERISAWISSVGAAVALADLDGDGHVDIIIGNYFQDGAHILDPKATSTDQMHDTKARSFNGGWKHLLLWAGATSGMQPTVQFDDVKGVLDEQIARAWTLAVGAVDLDGDLLPEIYFANDFGPDRLLHNLSTLGNLRFDLLEGRRVLT